MRRLTPDEYNNTLRDLLGDDTRPGEGIPAPARGGGSFDNDAENDTTTAFLADVYADAAQMAAARAVSHLDQLVSCPAGKQDGACLRAFVDSFGRRAWRGPLDAGERDRLVAVYDDEIKRGGGFADGVRTVLEVMLRSPRFLYRVESAAPVAGGKLGPWELASRLSYLLWGSLPDEALFTAAAEGRLVTPEQVASQATRMLNDARARAVVRGFARQWLNLDKIDGVTKDNKLYPAWNSELRPLLRAETETFFEKTIFDGDGKWKTLLTSPGTFLNAKLAAFYGVKGPPGEAFASVAQNATQRAGFLTHAGPLAAAAHPDQTSPVRRGVIVREQLLCDSPPPPPSNLAASPPPLDPALTTRERVAQHRAQASCAACHQALDPIGLGFESYDPVGLYRKTEGTKPIDATGALVGTDVDGPFTGAIELTQRLAGSAQAQSCFVRTWFRFAAGRAVSADDACAIAQLEKTFAGAGGDVRALLVALTQTETFLTRGAVVSANGGRP